MNCPSRHAVPLWPVPIGEAAGTPAPISLFSYQFLSSFLFVVNKNTVTHMFPQMRRQKIRPVRILMSS